MGRILYPGTRITWYQVPGTVPVPGTGMAHQSIVTRHPLKVLKR